MRPKLLRCIFKQLARLGRQEPGIAQSLSQALRQHRDKEVGERERVLTKIKKQEDHELMAAFLGFLQRANSSHTFDAHRARVRLVEIFTDTNAHVDKHGHLRRDRQCEQMQILEDYPAFMQLEKEQDRQWVREVVQRIFKGQERYHYRNLSDFFSDFKPIPSFKPASENLSRLPTPLRQYIEQALASGSPGVSQIYVRIYQECFGKNDRPQVDKVVDSYLRGRYVLLDLSDVTMRG